MEYFFGAQVNQTVKIGMVNCLVLAICDFQQKIDFYKTCSIKKWVMFSNFGDNVFGIKTLTNNLVLIRRFEDHNLMFCSLYMICEICAFC